MNPRASAWALGLAGLAPLAVAGGDAAAGRKVFSACINCHAVGPAARHGFGPQLNELVGRKAGASPGYAYSAGMKASGLVWSEATLTAFLRDPEAVVPGTKMRFWGLGMNERKVADLLAYLAAAQGQ
ncbi:MAG: c-type cytochrome [Burkholderiales bacterium]|nr:c-type cytochrome [Burkholderiales bacterium]